MSETGSRTPAAPSNKSTPYEERRCTVHHIRVLLIPAKLNELAIFWSRVEKEKVARSLMHSGTGSRTPAASSTTHYAFLYKRGGVLHTMSEFFLSLPTSMSWQFFGARSKKKMILNPNLLFGHGESNPCSRTLDLYYRYEDRRCTVHHARVMLTSVHLQM
jgi:hypothetical protein